MSSYSWCEKQSLKYLCCLFER
uniref:Uncharacterized protein n=1 Tax=Rhizophora mucronata TaxID=61149 RepID=A0A2P2QRZ1_RHIMU